MTGRARSPPSGPRDGDPEGVWDLTVPGGPARRRVRLVHSVGRRATPFGEYPGVWHGVTIDVTARLARGAHPPTVDATAHARPFTA